MKRENVLSFKTFADKVPERKTQLLTRQLRNKKSCNKDILAYGKVYVEVRLCYDN